MTRWYKPWFYKHVETFLTEGEGEEYIPLREYLLRHDKVPGFPLPYLYSLLIPLLSSFPCSRAPFSSPYSSPTHLMQAIFWVLESMIPFGNHPIFLALLGWMLPPKPAFMKLTTTPTVRAMTFTKQVFQDIVLPINKLEEQIDKVKINAITMPYKYFGVKFT